MSGLINSIQIGKVQSYGDPERSDALTKAWTTAFYKTPISGAAFCTIAGFAEDAVADRRYHGGSEKAVLAYAHAHYAKWTEELSPKDFLDPAALSSFGPGAFAENLTIAGQDETTVCIGDRYRIQRTSNTVLLEVSQPRQPCWKISRRWQHKTLTKLVTVTRRTGWYLRVIEEGELVAGDALELVDRPHPEWTIDRANQVLFSKDNDPKLVEQLLAVAKLSHEWKRSLV